MQKQKFIVHLQRLLSGGNLEVTAFLFLLKKLLTKIYTLETGGNMADLAFEVNCPHCKRSLMDTNSTVNNKPSIKTLMEFDDQKGTIHLSSIYGSFDYYTELKIKKGEIAKFKCPHCNTGLTSENECTECHAPMVNFNLTIGGMVYFCSRSGCKNHSVGFVDLSSALNTFYHKYKYGE